MLKQRIITAIVLVAVFLAVLFAGSAQIFIIFVSLVVVAAAWEWANLSGFQKPLGRFAYAFVVSSLAAFLNYCIFVIETVPLIYVLRLGALWWIVAFIALKHYPRSADFWGAKATVGLMGILVLLVSLASLLALRTMANGEWLVLALVCIVATADTGAYFAGRAFGKRKLAPLVSPGKTWAGVGGGLIAVTLATTIFVFVAHSQLILTLCVVLPVAAISVVGDLFESMLKRHREIKDSSNLLPGHGGVLDRVDALLAAAPVFALAILLTGWQF